MRAFEIYGADVSALKEKTKKRPDGARLLGPVTSPVAHSEQVMTSDPVHLDDHLT